MFLEDIITSFPSVSVKWVSEITHVDEPRFFVDEQRLEPFRFWHQQHNFRKTHGGVEVMDLVNYVLPFGYFSTLSERAVRDRFDAIIDFGCDILEGGLGNG